MTRFTSSDHTDALRACWDAADFGAEVADSDIVTLNRAAAAYAFNGPEALSRREFVAALRRVQADVGAAKIADPARAAKVLVEREAQAEAIAAKRRAEGAERKAKNERLNGMRSKRSVAAGTDLKITDPARYNEILASIRAELDAIPVHSRPKQVGAVGQVLLSSEVTA